MNTKTKNETAPARTNGELSLLETYAHEQGMSARKMYDTLAATIFPTKQSATPEQVHALLIVARAYGLNPWTKELYAFPAKGGGVVPVVSVDGWAKLVNSRKECDGIEIDVTMGDDGRTPVSATCTIHRKDWKHPCRITEYYHEVRRNTDPWKNQPVRMLRHRALIQAARIAFGFSGIYEADEAARFAADASPEHRESDVVDTRPGSPASLQQEIDEAPDDESLAAENAALDREIAREDGALWDNDEEREDPAT